MDFATIKLQKKKRGNLIYGIRYGKQDILFA